MRGRRIANTIETATAFSRLYAHYGSHSRVAEALGVAERTYSDWRKLGLPNRFVRDQVIDLAHRIHKQTA